MKSMAMSMAKDLIKGSHGNKTDGGGHSGSHQQKMDDKKMMKEAMKLAKTKDYKNVDPAVLNYAATRVQAGFRGYKTRKDLKEKTQ
jgi:hypothetical protein